MASHWFRISYAENAFKRVLAARGLSLETLSVTDGVEAMIDFYANHRAQHTEFHSDGDSLAIDARGSVLEVSRTMTRSDGTQPTRRLVLRFEQAPVSKRSIRVQSPDELALVRANLREEPLVKTQLPVHLRME